MKNTAKYIAAQNSKVLVLDLNSYIQLLNLPISVIILLGINIILSLIIILG